MADTKLTDLTAVSSATADDIVYIVDDPTGTPASKKITFDNLQKSITVAGGASGVSTQGDVACPVGNAFYIGAADADGSWRIVIDTGNLSFQKREGGTWVEKASAIA